MEDNILKYVYTLQEIGIALNLGTEEITSITYYSNKQNLDRIILDIPILKKFKPYIFFTKVGRKNLYVISSKIFDKYLLTGLLPDKNTEYREADLTKKEYWEYNSSYFFELNTKENWNFALSYFKDKDSKVEEEDIWNIFLAGCARMNYYQGSNINIDQRIKFAIMEYMIRRPQFFTTDDFIDNPVLHKKYNSNSIQNESGECYEQKEER